MASTKTIAIDFDGTLCENEYPNIGQPKYDVIQWVKDMQNQGYKIILWTCREKKQLYQAVHWCKKQGLQFDAINTDINWGGVQCKKLYADYYVDDHNLHTINGGVSVGYRHVN